jgi:ubiquinol-cytochrome c reductase iron-sulfur subunit
MEGRERGPTEEAERVVIATQPPRRSFGAGALAAAALALASTVLAYVEYAGPARPSRLALAMAGTFFGVAFALLLGVRSASALTRVRAPRDAPSSEAACEEGAPAFEAPGRRALVAVVGTSVASLAAGTLLPLRSLARSSPAALRATAWRGGVRLATLGGAVLRPADLAPGSATPVAPHRDAARPAGDADADANSLAVLVRLRGSGEVRAFSRICPHAGCAVSAFRAAESLLVCPCHHSAFDAARGGAVVAGPASLPLPELPLAVDDDGFLVAAGDFTARVGPRGG